MKFEITLEDNSIVEEKVISSGGGTIITSTSLNLANDVNYKEINLIYK